MAPYKSVLLLSCVILLSGKSLAQADTAALNSIRRFQDHLNAEYKDPKTSPLDPKAVRKFNGLPFFPADLMYRVDAVLTVTDQEPYFLMMTSDNRPRNYRQYGVLEFKIDETEFKIPVHQSQNLIDNAAYADYLFFPFTDLTNGKTSYAGGRFIDLRIPKSGNTIVVDFNKAYNPLCAYSNRYSCPVVPEKNHLEIEVNAGVQHINKH